MMAIDLARALDPAIIGVDVGLTLDPWQATLLRERPRRSLLLCARQTGKSTVTGLTCLHTAIYEAPAFVIVVSPSQRQSAEMLRTIMGFHARLEGAPALHAESVLKVEFRNGSRIVALPGTERTIRGYSAADCVVIDEAARVPDELIAAVRPMMATRAGGRLIALTTPAGKRGWFYEAWLGVKISASDCPRITPEFLAEELKELGAQRFAEEYGLEFLDNDEAVFPHDVITRAFTIDVRPLWA
jgi:hypothetical protein